MFNATYCIEHISYAKLKRKEFKTNMFRKLVSSLPFSPALAGQLAFYARRLKKEQITRRFGLILTVLALIMQSFAMFRPPEQALATSPSDIIPGGVSSTQQILSIYDAGAQGKNDFKDLMDYFGVTREELAATKLEKTCSKDRSIVSFGRQHIFSASEGELIHKVPSGNGVSTFYSTPLYLHDRFNGGSFCTDSFVGNSAKVGWFSIMSKCGNFQIKQDVRRLPKASFVTATCTAVQGFAYDERQSDQPVKVYLYFGGPPGKGEQIGPIVANSASPPSPAAGNHGFSIVVPDKYQTATQPTTVWGVMQPLAGWDEPNVQMSNTATIPGNCITKPTPTASCTALKLALIERTQFKATISSQVGGGATILGYAIRIVDNNNKTVFDKTYTTNAVNFTTDSIPINSPGSYTAKAVAKTSIGDQEGANCTTALSVAPPDKCKYNPALSPNDKDCQPCPYNPNLWIKDNDCTVTISQAKEARNLSQDSKAAATVTALAADRIEYTLLTTNSGNTPVTTDVKESLSDVLEYGTLIDAGGGNFDNTNKILSWNNITLSPGQTDTRKIVVQVFESIPSTPVASNNPSAFNCIMTNAYGNTINVRVDCPPAKLAETTVQQLPSTGPGENILFGTTLLMVVTYFYVRNRQMSKEVRLLRKEFNGGTI